MKKSLMARFVAPLVLVGAVMVTPVAATTAVASPSLPAYGPTTCTFTVSVSPRTFSRGQTISVTITGTCFNVTFTIQIHSATDTLGTITTNSSGVGSANFVVPTNLPDGAHTVSATSSVGSSQATPVVVSGGPFAAATNGTPSSALPLTGSNVVATTGVGAAAIVIGGLVVLGVRRRRASHFS